MQDAYRLWIPIDVRWGDMDSFGHVNNARYFTYCESARMAYFAKIGLDECKEAPEHGPALVTATCNFRQQVHHPAFLEVGARATRVGRSSFHIDYLILRREADPHDGESQGEKLRLPERGQRQPVADGTSVVVWVDYASGTSQPLPDKLRQRLIELDGPFE